MICGQWLAPRRWWNPVSPVVHDTPSGDCPVLLAKREQLRRLESEDAQDRYYLDLKGARERLCRAQTFAPSSGDRLILQAALDNIDLVGMELPQWSRFDQPMAPRDVTRKETGDG